MRRVHELASVIIVIAIIIGAIAAAGGLEGLKDGKNRCLAYKAAYADWVKKGRVGGAEEEARIDRLYGYSRAGCKFFHGVEI